MMSKQFSENNEFLRPSKSYALMNNYIPRRDILKWLKMESQFLNGKILDIGCGQMPYKKWLIDNRKNIESYIGVDLQNNPIHDNNPDFLWDGKILPFSDESFDIVLITEVMEHVFEPKYILSEAFRVLKRGGVIIGTVPHIYPLHEVPYDNYRYTPYAINLLFESYGFKKEYIRKLNGFNNAVAQILASWARRRYLPRVTRAVYTLITYPIVVLFRSLKEFENMDEFKEGELFTGLCFRFIKQ